MSLAQEKNSVIKNETDVESTLNKKAQKQSIDKKIDQKEKEFSEVENASNYQRTQKNPTNDRQKKMNKTVNDLEELSPESFEFHFSKYVAGNYNVSLFNHLQKAAELEPNNSKVHKELVAYYWITGDIKKTETYLTRLKSDGFFSESLLNYNKDMLLSVPKNGIVLTHGFEDSYSSMYLQIIENVRIDVQIIDLDFLQSDFYRNHLIQKGLNLSKSELIDVKYVTDFCVKNEYKNVSISLTVPKEYLQPLKSNLYVVGLVFEYHLVEITNYYRNEQLWGNSFNKKVVYSANDEKAKQISSNYLPMLLQLKAVYQQENNEDKLKGINIAIDKILTQSGKKSVIK